jgi:hypothetical protein
MKSSKEIKFVNENVHFHSKFWVWMKSSKEMKFVNENVHFHSKFWVWMKINKRKQTNSG